MRTLAHLRAPALGGALLLVALVSSACDSPCVALAKQVCRCEPTEDEQRACIQRVDDEAAVRTASESEEERCESLVDDCTCGKLANGDLAACGLADDPGSN